MHSTELCICRTKVDSLQCIYYIYSSTLWRKEKALRRSSVASILAHRAVVTVPKAPVRTVPHPGYVLPPTPILRTLISNILGGLGPEIIGVGRYFERDREVYNTLMLILTLIPPPPCETISARLVVVRCSEHRSLRHSVTRSRVQ